MPNFQLSTRYLRVLLPLSAGLMAAGCSADVARFEMPAGFAGGGGGQTSSIVPPANVYGGPPRAGLLGDADGASHPPPALSDDRGPRGGDVRVAELPPAAGTYDSAPRRYDSAPRSYDQRATATAPDSGSGEPGYRQLAAKPYDAAPRRRNEARFETASYGRGSGETIEVKPGDTLYGLSRQYGVPVSEIMSANDLKGHSLKPGQRLTLPAGHAGRATATPANTVEAAPAQPAVAAEATPVSNSAGTYTMKPGDSLYAIARQHKVRYADLQRHNGITDVDVRKIRPGTVLKIPAGGEVAASTSSTTTGPTPEVAGSEAITSAPSTMAPASQEPAKADVPVTTAATNAEAPKVLNAAPPVSSAEPGVAPAAAPAEADKKVAALEPVTQTDAAPTGKTEEKAASGGRLRWPVQGRVISAFGPRPDGTHNDGVNLSVPLGTDVHAAEGGEVIYVGDELKAYGKLVLLRHDNGWVTAYAHNEDLLVTRGKKVARGDVIAKAGKTGPVDQPQVHFELRQDSKAVDPTSFMEPQ
jgi:murein DD-endopeptidase MepM/ murein hydrolase activator NlpD